MTTFNLSRIESVMGELLMVTDDEHRLRALEYADHRARLLRGLREHYGAYALKDAEVSGAIKDIAAKLDRYFAGDLAALDDIAVGTNGSAFQHEVWAALRRIPAGQITTYGALARELGHTDPRMAKEIGAAVGANPIEVVVPCHRVIGSNGELKGYAGGVHRKQWLLAHEKVEIKPQEKKRRPSLPTAIRL